jgi:PKD repeat protein
MLFRVIPGAGWNFGPGATSGNKYDFETVVLHELGHAHQLGHVINNSYVMHYAVGTNTDKRTLSTVSDIAGGADIVDFSIANKPCGPQLMTKLNASNCELGLPPSADFTANTIAGCSPLQVSFQDNSTSNPISWAWDIDNNGTIDYTTKNPVHTYINSGNYSVKLTAINSNGSHSVIKNNVITVYNQPMAFGKGYYRICSGQTATLANSTAASGGTPPYQYSWSPINGLSNPAIANPTLLCTFPETRIYTLTVTDALGCSSVARDTIFPYLKLQINAGVDQSICKGSIINLGGSPTASSGYPPYQYSWFPVTGMNNPTDANPTIIVNQSETYICTVTDINNCAVKDTIIISMNPPVSVQAGQDIKVCKGTIVTLGGNPTAQGGTAPITFQWTPSTGLTNPNSANPSLTVQQSASYICTVIDGKGCIKKDTISIIMNPELIVQSSLDQTICEGNSVLIGGNSIANGGTPPYQYSWSPIQGLSSSIISQPLARPLSSTTYILTVTDAENCVKNDTINVNVDKIAKPTISVKGNTIICESDSVQLEIIGDYAEYEWSNGQKTKSIKVGKNGSFYSKCTASNGCIRVSDTVKVIVLPVPIVEVSGPKSVCINTSATYSVPKQNGVTTEWSVTGGTIISGINSESLIVQWASSNGRIAVVRKQTVCSAQSTVDIAVGELEKPVIALLDNIQPCIGNTVILKAPKGYAVYLWSNGSNKDTIHIDNSGIFTVQVWDENDCTKKSDTFFVQFNELPVKPNIIRIQDTLFASISHKYQWYKNQQILDGETKQFIKVLNSGDYQVYIQDTNLCGNISEEYAFDVSGISKNIDNNHGIKLYQSSDNELHISHQFRLPVIITIIDALGRELIQNKYNDNEITLSLHGFVSGLYSLIFWDGSNISTSVFIKR